MAYGHWGKGLRVNLTTGSIAVETLANRASYNLQLSYLVKILRASQQF